jgi:hypothetical protein
MANNQAYTNEFAAGLMPGSTVSSPEGRSGMRVAVGHGVASMEIAFEQLVTKSTKTITWMICVILAHIQKSLLQN